MEKQEEKLETIEDGEVVFDSLEEAERQAKLDEWMNSYHPTESMIALYPYKEVRYAMYLHEKYGKLKAEMEKHYTGTEHAEHECVSCGCGCEECNHANGDKPVVESAEPTDEVDAELERIRKARLERLRHGRDAGSGDSEQ